ncbi:hypothetical protein SVIOM342S_03046 [Streptomyces violaceorubidus]
MTPAKLKQMVEEAAKQRARSLRTRSRAARRAPRPTR